MDVNEVAKLLPEQPRPGMADEVFKERHYSDLGGEFLIYRRESIRLEPDLKRTMTESDYEDYEAHTQKRWGALCKCTACGEEFIAGYENKNGLTGIKIIQGEDGQLYPGYVEPEYDNYDVVFLNSGTSAFCPYCNQRVTVKAKNKLSERRYQVLVISIERVRDYAAIVTWLVSRKLDPYGYFTNMTVSPRNAAVIDEKGKMYCFRHTDTHFIRDTPIKEWKSLCSYSDPQFKKYYSYEAINHTKIDGCVWRKSADLTGTTGEKTGLQTYIEKGCCYPAIYMQLWKQYPQLENIVKSDYFKILESEISDYVVTSINYYGTPPLQIELTSLDLTEVKPHKMLHFTREEFRKGMNCEWNYETSYAWLLHDYYMSDICASEFDDYIATLGFEAVSLIDGKMIDGEDRLSLPEVTKYLIRQERKFNLPVNESVQYLIDYRNMLYQQQVNNLTNERLWPKNLKEAHDRLALTAKEIIDVNFEKNFERIAKKYEPLEWNDGELCIRVARSHRELIDEGNTLRHCVDRYGKRHLSESDVIFFVRRYRRPERSYYTLDIRMTERKPKEIQLHGYGNENHGEFLQHRHSIPRKVRNFCDRWENEILMPFYYSKIAKQKKKECKIA